jgi:xanthine dehydrogenase iron-sulfur cluster and FAD-binding subunit A
MWQEYYNVTSIDEAVQLLAIYAGRARIVAGATDLILEIERGVRKDIDVLIDISRVPCIDEITMDEDEVIHLGPMVTHNQCVASKIICERAFPLAMAAWDVGAPQIRNRGTVAGNLITASPANDTISPLIAMDAKVTLVSERGERIVPLSEFYKGVRKTVMQPDEILVDIQFPAMNSNQKGAFAKLGLRRAQAISVVNAAVVITFESSDGDNGSGVGIENMIEKVSVTLGSVAPTIIHAVEAENFLKGKTLSETSLQQAALLAKEAASPIDDVRSSADYRSEMVRISVLRCLKAIKGEEVQSEMPNNPVMLWGKNGKENKAQLSESKSHSEGTTIRTTINGKSYEFNSGHDKTLLRLLREEAGLVGTKEGCAEGECGACTVFLDGQAVMSCLVPAARAHGAEIVTVEGLAAEDHLHPVQEAFVEDGAVQCGYCTPGFLMSAAKLLEEKPHPTKDEIQQAITGNLCRCTGYYKIVQAIEHASEMGDDG